jgi:predicted alpha/beta superfamily hydrolase
VASSAFAKPDATRAGPATALTVGESFTLEARTLGEVRRINVYRPPSYADSADSPRPVLYMPDGGIGEDFLHVAGLLEVSVGNGTMRPFLLVGIENTQRRRDLTGPSANPEDRKIAPRVGGSAAFRSFIRSELMPVIRARYRTTGETAIMGESLAGLFVVETLFDDPDLFDTYIAFDPSLWWNDSALVKRALPRISPAGHRPRMLYMANSSDESLSPVLAERFRKGSLAGLSVVDDPMPAETHATIYHPAALRAVRRLFDPKRDAK